MKNQYNRLAKKENGEFWNNRLREREKVIVSLSRNVSERVFSQSKPAEVPKVDLCKYCNEPLFSINLKTL